MILTGLMVAVLLQPSAGTTVDFDSQIVPILTRAGCNAGACHGAAAGRGGFRLSLLGSDAAMDYDAIVTELEGRRVNLARPDESLLIGKPTGAMAHQGGIRLEADGPGTKRLADWIMAGAARDHARRLTRFDVSPADCGVDAIGAVVVLRAMACFNDGPAEDVTAWTVFTATDPAAVEIDADTARATIRRRGQHVLIARFLDRVLTIQLTLPLSDTPVDHSTTPRANFVDDEVLATLTTLRLPVSPPADDATFLRRVTLDLTGRLPTLAESEAFLAGRAADRRARLVDRLLGSEAYADYWAYRLATVFRGEGLPADRPGAVVYHGWLREQIHRGTPLDVVAREQVTAVGDTHTTGPANFARFAADARSQADLVARAFLGVRLQCANCHNHPFDRWTQDDYHGLAAVFAGLDRGRVVRVAARGAVTNPRTGAPAVPRIPGGRDLEPATDSRAEVAAWLTAPGNPLFARAAVNRLWRAMFGRGLVEPADDLRDTNPATHPALLTRLAADFVAHRYDLRRTLRVIALSETYRRGGEILPGNRADDRFYSRSRHRPLDPEVLADAIADVTGVSDQYGEEPVGTRAVALADPRTPAPSLELLGRCTMGAACGAGDGGAGAGLPAQLHQLNGELINRKLTAAGGRLQRLIVAGRSDEQIVAEFYLRALGRRPTATEQDYWRGQRTAAGIGWLEDVVWSLLSCAEFRTNH